MTAEEFTEAELEILKDAEIMQMKQRVMNKIFGRMERLRDALKDGISADADRIPGESLRMGGKISRGENHHGYAWMALDYPAVFSGKDIFAFRSIVLWGHYAGFYLLLSGKYLARYKASLAAHAASLSDEWRIDLDADLWNWLPQPGQEMQANLLEESALNEVQRLRLMLRHGPEQVAELTPPALAAWDEIHSILP